MKKIGLYEAKTNLSSLVADLEVTGEREPFCPLITVTLLTGFW